MLTIMRKYTIGVHPNYSEEIENKLKDLNISITKTNYNGWKFHGVELIKKYYDCMSDEEEMDILIEYLQLEFKGTASIIY